MAFRRGALLEDDDLRVGDGLEERQVAKVDDRVHRRRGVEVLPQPFPIPGAQPFVGGDKAGDAALPQQVQRAGVEVDVEVGGPCVHFRVTLLERRLVGAAQQLLPHVGRVCHDDVEARRGARRQLHLAGRGVHQMRHLPRHRVGVLLRGEHFGELHRPIEALLPALGRPLRDLRLQPGNPRFEVALLPSVRGHVLRLAAEVVLHLPVAEEVGLEFARRGGGQTVAHLDLEVQVGQRERLFAGEIHDQREPQAQPGDVHREGVDVHAVEVVLDDFQLAVVGRARVEAVRRKERLAQFQQLVQHPQKVRAAAAREVADPDALEGLQRPFRRAKTAWIAPIHERGDGLRYLAGARIAQIALERLAAHKGHLRLGRVVTAALVAPGDQFLEDFPQHLRVHRHFHVQRRALGHGEVVVVEQVIENRGEDRIRRQHIFAFVQGIFLKQAAVEVGDVADVLLHKALGEGREIVHAAGVVQPGEEEHFEAVAVEVRAAGL